MTRHEFTRVDKVALVFVASALLLLAMTTILGGYMKKLMSFWPCLLATMILSCTKGPSNDLPYGLKKSDTLILNLSSEPPSLDWHKQLDSSSAYVISNLMKGLAAYDVNDPKFPLKPMLAEKWTRNPSATQWTFTLRSDVKWTDGTTLTPQHFIDAWERLLNPETSAPAAYLYYDIVNAKAYNKGQIKDFSKVGVTLDGQNITVSLNKPRINFPLIVSGTTSYPIRKDIIEKFGPKWTAPENIQTLGAYRMTQWKHDEAIVLTRNPTYFSEPAKTKNLLFYMIAETSTAMNLFDQNEIDIIDDVPTREIEVLKQRDEYNVIDAWGVYYYGFNTRKPPLDNILVRQALAYAIDRGQVVKLLGGGQKPAPMFLVPGFTGFEPSIGTRFFPEKARSLLKQAGYGPNNPLPKIYIGFNTSENHQRIAENIQNQLMKNLDIQVELKNQEWKVYLKSLQEDPPHIYRMGWLVDQPAPDDFLEMMTTDSNNNYTGWKSQKYDRMVASVKSSIKEKVRHELTAEAQKLILEKETTMVPIYSYTHSFMISKSVENFPLNPAKYRPLEFVSVNR